MAARISPDMIARSRTLSDPRWSPGGARLAWIEAGDGRSDVLVAGPAGELPVVVTAECGAGGGFAWISEDELVVAGADGRLAVVHAEGGVVRVLTRDGRAFAPSVSVRGEVAFGLERDDACDIATVPVDASQWPQRVSHADYAWDPVWSPDGRELAWHEWDLPNMPWDASRIVVRDDDGKTRVVADAPACGQPRFSPDGAHLAYIREMRLWVVRAERSQGGRSEGAMFVDDAPVLDEEYEHAEASWGPGQRSFAWSPASDALAWCRNEDGFGRLVIGALGAKSARELSKGWHRGIDWRGDEITCVRSGAVTVPQIVALAANGSARRTLARGAVGGFERTPLVEPRAVTWRSGSATVHGLLWRAANHDSAPMIVSVHGGPTGQAIADWNARVQYYVQRGFTVLQPNYRGSTGYGTAYRRALEGKWGARDADDVAAGIRHAVKEGWCDGHRVALMGGSAGGLTVLQVAARHPDLVAAVVALFPVTDLLELNETTHRFESGYNSTLVGPLPDARDTYVANSAVTHAAAIRASVMLLHGSDDKSVPPSQSARVEEILRRAGTPVERHVYEGEGHGWRRTTTLLDEFSRVEAFFARTLG